MPNLFVSLPLPPGSGVGAPADVSAMGRDKTIIVDGSVAGTVVTIEASVDGVTFAPVATFATGTLGEMVVSIAAKFLRTRVAGTVAGVTVSANDNGGLFSALTLPVGNGIGPTFNASEHGSFSSFIVGGVFPGAAVNIQGSADGVIWATVASFNGAGGIISRDEIADLYRVVVSGRGAGVFTATAGVGSINDGITAADNPPLAAFVYRPGATGAEAPPNSHVYTDWYKLMAAVDATKHQGYRYIQFDNRFAPNPALDPVQTPFAAFNNPLPALTPLVVGLYPCAIPPPPQGQVWDMLDVIWTDRGGSPGLDSTYIRLLDGGANRPCRIINLKRIDAMIFGINYDGLTVGNHPFKTSLSNVRPEAGPFYGLVFEGVRLRMYNTNVNSQPMWLSDIGPGAPPSAQSFLDIQNNAALGLNPFNPTQPSPAPVFEIAVGATLILFGKRTTQIQNNTFKGLAGSTISIQTYFSEVWGNAEDQNLQWVQPAFQGSFPPMVYLCATQRFRPSPTVLAANGAAFFGEVCKVNSAAGPIRVNLPKASFPVGGPTGAFPWEGTAIVVLDVAVVPVPGNITVRAANGDKINESVPETGVGQSDTVVPVSAAPPYTQRALRFWPDRTTTQNDGSWFTIE